MAGEHEKLMARGGEIAQHGGGGLRPIGVEVHQHVVEHQRQRRPAPGVGTRQGQPQTQEKLLPRAPAQRLDRQGAALRRRPPGASDRPRASTRGGNGLASAGRDSRTPPATSRAGDAAGTCRGSRRACGTSRPAPASGEPRLPAASPARPDRVASRPAAGRRPAIPVARSTGRVSPAGRAVALGCRPAVAANSPARLSNRPGWLVSNCWRIASSEHCEASAASMSRAMRLALAAEHVGPGELQRPLAELLLVLDADFDEQLAAAVFLPADRLLVFAVGRRGAVAARGGSPRGVRQTSPAARPLRQARATWSEHGGAAEARREHAGVGGKLNEPAPRTNPIPPAAGQVPRDVATNGAASRRSNRRAATRRRSLFRGDRLGKPGRGQGLAPAPAGRLERFFRLAQRGARRRRPLAWPRPAGRLAARFPPRPPVRFPPPAAG